MCTCSFSLSIISNAMTNILSDTIYLSLFTVWIFPTWCEMSAFHFCHDDFSFNPADGLLTDFSFPWLGFTQYLHEVTKLLHPNKAPRVVLIHKQFVIASARDMLNLPKHYNLGNMIFGDYEQDEKDCGLTPQNVLMGKRCPRAYMEMPFLEVMPHPEFSRFGIKNSIALVQLLRPMKSYYMLPACLPTYQERARKKNMNTVFLIDYISAVPRDFDFEKLGKRTLKLYTDTKCMGHQNNTALRNQGLSQYLCTSGCGMRPGAPIISHTIEGRFELLGLAVGNSRCTDQVMRRRFNDAPPLYIDVYPFVPWIINVINAHRIPKPYPQHFHMVEGGSRMGRRSPKKTQKSGWKGRTYLLGDNCFGGWQIRKQAAFFYMEKFEARADTDKLPTTLNITVQISSGIECMNACYRLLLPHREIEPITKTSGIHFTLNMNILSFKKSFYFSLGISGTNATRETYFSRREKYLFD